MNETLQIFLAEPGKNHLKPFSNLKTYQNTLFATSNDGRLFQLDPNNYTIKNSFELHNSWISSIAITNDYLVTASYDASVSLFKSNEILTNSNPKFITQTLHNDYILACSLSGKTLVTASSEPLILISTISDSSETIIQPLQCSAPLSCSCHALYSDEKNPYVFCGFSDGSLSLLDFRNNSFSFDKKNNNVSSIKSIEMSNNGNYLCVGYLDGNVSVFDTRTFNEISKYHGEERVLSIQKYNEDDFIVFFQNSAYLMTNEKTLKNFNINKGCTSCVMENENVFHICDQKGILHRIEKGKETKTLDPSVSCKKILRLPHSTDLLMKRSNKDVILLDGFKFTEKENFGKVDFNQKFKELSLRQSFYFPISFDVTTGIPKIIISNFIPRIVHPYFVNERAVLSKFTKCIIENKNKVVCINAFNVPIWKSKANERLPNWMKYAIDPQLPYQ